MAQPTYAQWSNSNFVGVGLVAQNVTERMLAALVAYVLQINPDGTIL